jgi:hypothetical protein
VTGPRHGVVSITAMIAGAAIASASAVASVALAVWTAPTILRWGQDPEAVYGVMLLAPGAFICGLGVILGLKVMLEGRRMGPI